MGTLKNVPTRAPGNSPFQKKENLGKRNCVDLLFDVRFM